MGVFDDITIGDDVKITEQGDYIGGGFSTWPTNVYDVLIEAAFFGKSKGGAHNVTLHLKDPSTGKVLKTTVYISTKSKKDDNGVEKGCKTTYVRKGETFRMPGYSLIDQLCMLVAGKHLVDLKSDVVEKIVPIYDYDQKKEVNTPVQMLAPLTRQKTLAAIYNNKVDKNAQDDSGTYVPTGETREENEVDKFFRVDDKLTVTEIQAKATTPVHLEGWLKQWEGKVRDRTDKEWWAKNPDGAAKASTPGAIKDAPDDTIFEL